MSKSPFDFTATEIEECFRTEMSPQQRAAYRRILWMDETMLMSKKDRALTRLHARLMDKVLKSLGEEVTRERI